MADPKQRTRILEYVSNVILAFAEDDRVLAWDVWNEPDNTNDNSYGINGSKQEPEKELKQKLSLALLDQSFNWARQADPTQPLTSGVWRGDWSSDEKLTMMEKVQLTRSDVITFHTYDPPEEVKRRVETLKRFGRPILCTEYMARPRGSRFEPVLEYFKQEKIGAYIWGFVAGKTQTIYPWDSWQKQYTAEPPVWFHDVFRPDGTPYDPKEVEYVKRVTGKK